MGDVDNRDAARRDLRLLAERMDATVARIERDAAPAARTSRPSPDEWSLTEVVQHLALVSQGLLRASRPGAAEESAIGTARFAMLSEAMRSRIKLKAPSDRIIPRPGVTWEDATTNARSGLEAWNEFVESDRFTETAFEHPLAGTLSGAQTVAFLLDHFEHHVPQIERLITR